MTYHNNIEQALKAQYPKDRIVKVISNKLAIVQSAYIDGSFSGNNLAILINGQAYTRSFYKSFDSGLKRYLRGVIKEMNLPITDKTVIFREVDGKTLGFKRTLNNKRIIREHRKIFVLLNQLLKSC